MLKRTEPRPHDAVNTYPWSHSHRFAGRQTPDGEKVSTVTLRGNASSLYDEFGSSARRLSELEAQNAELRNTATNLERAIEHLHVAMSSGRRNFDVNLRWAGVSADAAQAAHAEIRKTGLMRDFCRDIGRVRMPAARRFAAKNLWIRLTCNRGRKGERLIGQITRGTIIQE